MIKKEGDKSVCCWTGYDKLYDSWTDKKILYNSNYWIYVINEVEKTRNNILIHHFNYII